MLNRRALLALLAAPACGAEGAPIRWSPRTAFNGAPILFTSDTYSGSATWLGKQIQFRPDGHGFSALAGANLNRTPGEYPLEFGTNRVMVRIARREYPASTISVAPKFVEPPEEVRQQIAEESAVKKKVFQSSPVDRLWSGAFAAPAKTRYTSSFGVRRVYNGKTNSVHQGLDYQAAPGTPILASNAGRVAIARPMYFEGGLVVIDHGEGLFTLYMHLSEILVNEGVSAEKGQPVGKSGATGRVTGPHLHFAVQWQGAYLEPATLLGLWKA